MVLSPALRNSQSSEVEEFTAALVLLWLSTLRTEPHQRYTKISMSTRTEPHRSEGSDALGKPVTP